jgi:diaminohydroxyphosphoribosylaminopyrimidine deaminase/5-amino-6-(5-phosphoribosylamino)uracil reductase
MFDKATIYQNLDDAYMAQCLQLAELGAGFVSPNPMVGAIVLDSEGRVVGRGYHPKVGEGHAEVFALDEASEKAKGGTLYVNLEPCNHQGRTPPCTQKIIDAGITRVVCGTLDPNPLVSGAGRDRLQNERISVRTGFLQADCEKLNESFFYHIRHQMPFVTVKLALSMDGKIANRHKESKWLTNPYSRQIVHQMRQSAQAVVTTAETVLADDPNLTVRDIAFVRRQPDKIIFDRSAKLEPTNYKVFRGDNPITWVVSENHLSRAEAALKAAKRTLPEIESTLTLLSTPEKEGHLDLPLAFKKLYQKGLANLFVESGGQFASALLDQQLVQKLYLFYAPKVIRDTMAPPAFSQLFELNFPQNAQFKIIHSETIENDWLIEARPLKAKVTSEAKSKKLLEQSSESTTLLSKAVSEEKPKKLPEPSLEEPVELSSNGTSAPRRKKVAEPSSEESVDLSATEISTTRSKKTVEQKPAEAVELSPNGTSTPRRKKSVEPSSEEPVDSSTSDTSIAKPKKLLEQKPQEFVESSFKGTSAPRRKKVAEPSSEESVELSPNGTSTTRSKKIVEPSPEEPVELSPNGTSVPRRKKAAEPSSEEPVGLSPSATSTPLPQKGFRTKLRRTR